MKKFIAVVLMVVSLVASLYLVEEISTDGMPVESYMSRIEKEHGKLTHYRAFRSLRLSGDWESIPSDSKKRILDKALAVLREVEIKDQKDKSGANTGAYWESIYELKKFIATIEETL